MDNLGLGIFVKEKERKIMASWNLEYNERETS